MTQLLDSVEVIIPLAGAIDLDKERARLSKEKTKLEKEIGGLERKLSNEGFLAKAPPQVVEENKTRLESAKSKLEELSRTLGQLG